MLLEPKIIIESTPDLRDSWMRERYYINLGQPKVPLPYPDASSETVMVDARSSLSILPLSITAAVALGAFPTLAEYAIDIAKAKEAERLDLAARDAERQFKVNTIEYGGSYTGNRAARRRQAAQARRQR